MDASDDAASARRCGARVDGRISNLDIRPPAAEASAGFRRIPKVVLLQNIHTICAYSTVVVLYKSSIAIANNDAAGVVLSV
jgi:hypothetical protein